VKGSSLDLVEPTSRDFSLVAQTDDDEAMPIDENAIP
jgi:hypothetical protein